MVAGLTSTRLPLAGEPPPGPQPHPLLRKGFRLFFFLAALHAAVAVPLWIVVRAGAMPWDGWGQAAEWHAHEMIFGFTIAVIAGFLLTATSNWTKRVTAVGLPLLLLGAIWLAGRVAIFLPGLPPVWVAVVDGAFLPALAIAIGRPIALARSKRNYVFLVLVGLLFGTLCLTHLDASPRHGHLLAVNLIVLIILIVSGRIIPAFTRSATGSDEIRSSRSLERATTLGMGTVVAFDAFVPDEPFVAGLAGVVGIFAAARARHWGFRKSTADALLLVLHVGHAWVVVGLVSRALSAFTTLVPSSAALHALTAGAIGTLTLGMMARVSLGHTGRPLAAGPALTAAFVIVTAAALIRVAGTFLDYALYQRALEVSAALWSTGFAIYLLKLSPALFSPRPDGKPG